MLNTDEPATQRRENALLGVRLIQWQAVLGILLMIFAALAAIQRFSWFPMPIWVPPVASFVAGLVLIWSPLDIASHYDARRPDLSVIIGSGAGPRIALGGVLSLTPLWWFNTWEFTEVTWVRSVLGPLVVIAGLGLILAPWWLRLIRQLRMEHESSIREFERAEIAAHLHDSVLQTLTLIRKNSENPGLVSKLARAQERDLRSYLYQEKGSPAESFSAAVTQMVDELEDLHGVVVETVTVGDTSMSRALEAVVKASREALTNAIRHGQSPIVVYAEVADQVARVFVRDGGPGFDQEAIPEDRLGIRGSIIGRVQRHGGSGVVNSKRGTRTEVAISMPIEERA